MSAKEIRFQPHETRFLEFAAQERGMALSVMAEALGRSLRGARETAWRLKQAGQIEVTRLDYGSPGPWRRSRFDSPESDTSGPLWIYVLREIVWSYIDFDPGPWQPRSSTAAHMTAVTRLRLALTGMDTDPEAWTSERLLYHQLKNGGAGGGHVHDAWFRDFADPDQVWAIEVELSRKRGAGRLLAAMSGAVEVAEREGLAGVLYFVRGEALRHAVEATAQRLAHKRGVESLPNLEIHDLDATLARKEVNRP